VGGVTSPRPFRAGAEALALVLAAFAGLYDAGDLTGLATNGLGQGCFHPVRSHQVGERWGPVAVPTAALT
jgi:hypothetical protein